MNGVPLPKFLAFQTGCLLLVFAQLPRLRGFVSSDVAEASPLAACCPFGACVGLSGQQHASLQLSGEPERSQPSREQASGVLTLPTRAAECPLVGAAWRHATRKPQRPRLSRS